MSTTRTRTVTKSLVYFAVTISMVVLAHGQSTDPLIKIPVVFHVLYFDDASDNGINDKSRDEGNSTSKLTRDKILAELSDLDADFQRKNADISTVHPEFKNTVGNPYIHFYLADIKYTRVSERDIRRPKSNTDLLHKLSPIQDEKTYLNVYISSIKYKGKDTNGLSPVKTSSDFGKGYDVVNLNFQWVGLGYRLLTHEVGHWLGLWHTWDDKQSKQGIDDIPLQTVATDVDCVKCPPNVPDRIRRPSSFRISNFNNFMDYSGCRSMFSIKQAKHMRYVLQNSRSKIWNNGVI